jgi:RNA polymerase sigma factor (TIGR02999 family)
MSQSGKGVTGLLQAWTSGDFTGRADAIAFLYRELRQRAAAHLRRERPGHTLQPTALVHEAYIRLVEQQGSWQNRAQFLALASQMMRRILVDRARARLATKRSGQWTPVSLEAADELPILPSQINLLDLNSALDRLAELDARKSRIAEMKFFGGLSLEEMGEVLQMSPRTVERDWQAARALLFKMLSTTSTTADQ